MAAAKKPAAPAGFRWTRVYVLGKRGEGDSQIFRTNGLEEKSPFDFSYWKCAADNHWHAVDRMTGVSFLNAESIREVHDAVHSDGFLTRFRKAQQTELYGKMVSRHYKGMCAIGAYAEL